MLAGSLTLTLILIARIHVHQLSSVVPGVDHHVKMIHEFAYPPVVDMVQPVGVGSAQQVYGAASGSGVCAT